MYSPGQILEGLQNPRFAALHFNRRFADSILKKFRPPTDFFTEDWDNLLILDASRYDMMTAADLGIGSLEYRWSPGSDSSEVVEFHIDNQTLDDVVWVTANPWVSKHREKIFEVIDMWETGWDDELQTVPPETMQEAALEAASEYPNKRLVVHFMQPHYPFIGEFGRSELPTHRTFTGGGLVTEQNEEQSVWEQLRDGTVSEADVWKAYTENLDVVLPVARDLCADLTGRSVITSDHGNELGKRAFPVPIRLYGHPSGLRTKNLVKVPWIVYEGTERKAITAGEMETKSSTDTEVIEDRLSALGYHE